MSTFLNYIVLLALILLGMMGYAQDSIPRKIVYTQKVSERPKIDGKLNELIWQNAAVAKDFIERIPSNGKPEPDSLRTEVKIIYDDLGIYLGATMYDPEPEKIQTELTARNEVGSVDFIYFLINGYNDRQQSLQFLVSAANVQYDSKITNGNEDPNWDGIWYSAVEINDDGWVAEIFIPYSELRFPDKPEQIWGLNIEREVRRNRTRYVWNPIDNKKGSLHIYDGELHGITNINPPTRLSFQPYISSYYTDFDGKSDVTVNGGLDLKYGISDAFTLDMILIPDFGQTKFDESVLNLSAFEVQYQENRPFFTEGTELFSKGNLFYSRRVGGGPSLYPNLGENEKISEFPARIDLLNAFKISGRTKKNLGIGIFNAITEKTYAKILNEETGETRKELVEPLANYNVFVLDQRFGQNNSISLVNTNTMRNGSYRDANATGLYADITNKSNTWKYWGNLEGSWVMEEDTKFGMEGSIAAAKISGANRLQFSTFFRTKDYDINDLGYTGATNYINYYAYYGYRLLQPKGFLNNMNLNFNLNYNRRLESDLHYNANFNFNSSFTTRKFFTFGGGFETTIFKTNDIYEPRTFGRHLVVPMFYDMWGWISTDYRKKLAIDVTLDWYKYDQKGRGKLIFDFSPRYRVSDKFKLFYGFHATLSDKETGFAGKSADEIYIGERDRNTIENSLEAHYIFNEKMALNLAFRHYFTDVTYDKFYTLNDDGSLSRDPEFENQHNATYNSWNVDLRFNWWFAPGSQLSLLYRNSVESYEQYSNRSFNDNFNYMFDQPQLNSFSIKVSYYLDYNRMKHWFKKNPSTTESAERISYHDYKNFGTKRI